MEGRVGDERRGWRLSVCASLLELLLDQDERGWRVWALTLVSRVVHLNRFETSTVV